MSSQALVVSARALFRALTPRAVPDFKSALSVEKDADAHSTLKLRHFVRAFGTSEFPEDYYNYLTGDLSLDELYAAHPKEKASAADSARRITLGEDSRVEVKRLLKARLKDCARWALVGGPPCQAYSLVGRSRMGGDPYFEQDERHFLYKEYLKIIADHLPPVFVMENVKGLLSATVEGVLIITRIVADLENPSKAVRGRSDGVTYRLYSLVEQEEAGGTVDPRMFIVRAEDFGVPQARHRMFIVGVRSDLNIRPSLLKRQDAPSVRDMIDDLPRIRSRLSREVDSPARWRAAVTRIRPVEIVRHLNGAAYTKAVRSEIEVVTGPFAKWPEDAVATAYANRPGRPSNAVSLVRDPVLRVLDGHVSRSHMASDLQRYLFAAVFADATKRSPKLADFPPSLLPAHSNVSKGVAGDMFADRIPRPVARPSFDDHHFPHLQGRPLFHPLRSTAVPEPDTPRGRAPTDIPRQLSVPG